MVLKTRDDGVGAHRIQGTDSFELLEITTLTGLKIHTSDSSFEVELEHFNKLPQWDAPKQRRIRFSSDNETFLIVSRNEITSSEKKSSWYRRPELKQMRRDGEAEEDQGVECMRTLHQLMATSVVLDEQERQKKQEVYDPILLSRNYIDFISRSRRSIFMTSLMKQQEKKSKKQIKDWAPSDLR
jgi:hypothetical protein